MPNHSQGAQAIIDPRSTAGQVRSLRTDFRKHAQQDRDEFAAVRSEHAKSAEELKMQIAIVVAKQDQVSENIKTILHALGLSGAGDHTKDAKQRRRKRPAAMMGGWELVWKIGGAIGGLMLIWKMVFAGLPGLEAAAVGFWHAVLAMNHVATQ